MTYNPQPLFDFTAEHGVEPVWDARQQKLYWVDLLKGHILIGDPSNLKVEKFSIGKALGVLAPSKSRGLVLAAENEFIFFDTDKNSGNTIATVPTNVEHPTRFNDWAVDPKGRFLAGTMTWDGATNVAKLYRLDTDQTVTQLEEHLHIPNGMDWSADGSIFFLTDTNQHRIYAYDYDLKTGNISDRRVHIQFRDDEFPDGMTIDAEGHFWIAFWGGGKIGRFDAVGNPIENIQLSVPHPTSCCFGEPDIKTLFVTTSQLPLSADEKKGYPLAGRTFNIQTDSVGREEPLFVG